MEATAGLERPVWTGMLSSISWSSVVAGAFVAAALSLTLLALGAGLGLAAVSPWSGSGVSGSTFTNITGAYLLMVAIMSSAFGGYLASRLRSKWTGIHTNEVFFRDTAHGLVAWAFATVLSASVLGGATAHIVNGAFSGSTTSSSLSSNPIAVFVDKLFWTDAAVPVTAATVAQQNNTAVRAELVRLWTADFTESDGLPAADRAYVARLVAAQTGMAQGDAEKHVDDVVNETKAWLDRTRRSAMKLAFWLAAALLFGAFAASLAAVEGGQHRDGTWSDRKLVPRAW
jgi:hypothetical protein